MEQKWCYAMQKADDQCSYWIALSNQLEEQTNKIKNTSDEDTLQSTVVVLVMRSMNIFDTKNT